MIRILSTVIIACAFVVFSATSASASAILELSSTATQHMNSTRNVSEAYLYVESVSEISPLFDSGKYDIVVRVIGTKPVLINPNMPDQGYYLDKIAEFKGAKIKAATSMRIAKISEREIFHLGGKKIKAYMIMNNEDSFAIKNIQILPDSWSEKDLLPSSNASESASVDQDAGVVLH